MVRIIFAQRPQLTYCHIVYLCIQARVYLCVAQTCTNQSLLSSLTKEASGQATNVTNSCTKSPVGALWVTTVLLSACCKSIHHRVKYFETTFSTQKKLHCVALNDQCRTIHPIHFGLTKVWPGQGLKRQWQHRSSRTKWPSAQSNEVKGRQGDGWGFLTLFERRDTRPPQRAQNLVWQ